MHKFIISFSILLSVTALISCRSAPPASALEQVAKDWSMTVRASQVMPIYPLEEDLRPGDAYLSLDSLASEIETWKKKGFLPLINRYARIPISKDTYDKYFESPSSSVLSASYSRPSKAAFPSYSFSVDERGSLGLALPLSSVPVALSAVGAKNATGSAVLTGASTQGLPDQVVDEIVVNWAKANKEILDVRVAETAEPVILRVITRIFSIEGATVSLDFGEVSGASLQAGSEVSPPELISASQAHYESLLTYLNKQVELKKGAAVASPPATRLERVAEIEADPDIAALEADVALINKLKNEQQLKAIRGQISNAQSEASFGGYLLPGVGVKITSRSARGVSMVEKFEKPLVIGYWAVEYLVTPGGELMRVGKVQDLIDHPDKYQALVQRTNDILRQQSEPAGTYKKNMFK